MNGPSDGWMNGQQYTMGECVYVYVCASDEHEFGTV